MSKNDTNYMCRVNVPLTRLYSNADDITPQSKFIERDEIVYTDYEQEHYDGSIRLRIYEPEDYAGLWIVKADCDTMVIEQIESRDIHEDDNITRIIVTADNPIVYKTKDATTRISSSLFKGEVCICDEKELGMSNGMLETRYHIIGTESGNSAYNGYWILCDSKVTNSKTNRVIDVPVKAKTKDVITDLKDEKVYRAVTFAFIDTVPKKTVVDVTQIGPDGLPMWERPPIIPVAPQKPQTNPPSTNNTPPPNIDSPLLEDVLENMTKYPHLNMIPSPEMTRPPLVITPDDLNALGGNLGYTVDTSQKVNPNADSSNQDKFTSVHDKDLDIEKALNGSEEELKELLDKIAQDMINEDEKNRYDNTAKDDYDYYKYNFGYDSTTFMSTPVRRLGYVHGLPFQFTHITDRRIGSRSVCGAEDTSSDLYGRTFSQEIIANIPVAIFVPGEPSFLSAISKNGIIGSIVGAVTGNKNVKEGIKSLLTENGITDGSIQNFLSMGDGQFDYFSMKTNLAGYFQLVNSMTRFMAKNLGLEKRHINGNSVRCDKVDWSRYNKDVDKNSDLDAFLSLDGGVSFAYDPQSAISDSLSNSTGDSKLAGLLNQSSSYVREINFVMGAAAGKQFLNNDQASFATTGDDGLMGRLSSFLSNTVSGLNIRFPEIWQDSSSSKDYSIDMKFVAPYATPFCIWRYVLVPFAHVLALSGARSLERINSYSSPPLIRAFSKGYFNVEMGIITSCTWKKFGEGDMMSDDGLPTQMDISLQFKDLYHSLSISPWKATNLGLFFNNTGLVDLLGTLSGMNMNRATLEYRLGMFGFAFGSAVKDVPSNIMRHINDRVRDVAVSFLHLG